MVGLQEVRAQLGLQQERHTSRASLWEGKLQRRGRCLPQPPPLPPRSDTSDHVQEVWRRAQHFPPLPQRPPGWPKGSPGKREDRAETVFSPHLREAPVPPRPSPPPQQKGPCEPLPCAEAGCQRDGGRDGRTPGSPGTRAVLPSRCRQR